jgi:hypothetical protein
MFRKVLGYTAFAIGGVAAFKLTGFIIGLVLSVVLKVALLALFAFAVYTAVGFFFPAIFGTEKQEDSEAEEVEVSEDIPDPDETD